MRKTKIVVTIGPSSNSKESVLNLIKSGVDVFRLNFSHGSYESHKQIINLIRECAEESSKHVGILQDIAGPKVRIGEIQGQLDLEYDDELVFVKSNPQAPNETTLSYPDVLDELNIGDMIYLYDGTIRVEVTAKEEGKVITKTLVGGKLTSRKGVNFPDAKVNIPSLTKKDISDIIFGIENGVDFIALSFIKSAQDILSAKTLIKSHEVEIPIFAKIEKFEAIENLDSIIDCSDGIMIARGDLGVEVGFEKVPKLQKMISYKANQQGKPVITATQMLTSMINSPFPTRAEISDIANAVLDGTDAVMLSDETAVGKFPIHTVEVLNSTIRDIETIYPFYKNYNEQSHYNGAVAASANVLTKNIDTEAIVVFTRSGRSAMDVSVSRPKATIFANAASAEVCRKLSICWGVFPAFVMDLSKSPVELITTFAKEASKTNLIKQDQNYIIIIGSKANRIGKNRTIRLLKGEDLERLEH